MRSTKWGSPYDAQDRERSHRPGLGLQETITGMSTLLIVVILAVIAIATFALKAKAQPPAAAYTSAGPLLTPAELRFYEALKMAISPQQQIFAKTRIADLINPAAGTRASNQAARNRIQSKHVDFVICDAATTKVVACVELNDKSHEREDRKARDSFVKNALEGAGIRLHFVRAARSYDANELRTLLAGQPTMGGRQPA